MEYQMVRLALRSFALSAALACISIGSSANAATFNIGWSNLSAGEFSTSPTGISRTLNGVTVTATGYRVTVPSGGGLETVTGPLPTVDVAACTNLNPAICPGGRDEGLRISQAGLGIREVTGRVPGDTTLGLNGFTNTQGDFAAEFIAFSFSSAVDLGSIVVDDVSNSARPIWFAASDFAVDFSGGLASALSGLSVENSVDDASDGLFSHAVNLTDITTLIVGAPFASGNFFGIEPRSSNFYIESFGGVSLSDTGTGGSTTVPLPAGLPLMLSGLVGIGLLVRRKKKA
ncbi:VPLPA-CTERM sorting domain-containing protein [Rhodobacteraceae bacterium NNCM2]|nr:VPLPA-CTERM sorting domain-containing protein [Coraliihabitans acroporae]